MIFKPCLLFVLCVAAVSCSSLNLNPSGNLKTAPNGNLSEYEALKESISQYHDLSIYEPDHPWLFSEKGTDQYFQDFADGYCLSAPIAACERMFREAVNSVLTRVYFAADTSAVAKKCQEEPLICGDLQTLEVLFRNLHNESVGKSKQEKLAEIEAWSNKKLTDSELETALHVQFKFSDGRLRISLPGPAYSVAGVRDK